MKKLAMVLLVLFGACLMVTFLPKQVFKPDNPNIDTDIAFKAYCPVAISIMPDVPLINMSTKAIYPLWLKACLMKELADRHLQSQEYISAKGLDFNGYVLNPEKETLGEMIQVILYAESVNSFHLQKPHYAAYFYDLLFHHGNILSAAHQLGVLFAEGNGVAKNTEKAAQLFRITAIDFLPNNKSGMECERHTQDRFQIFKNSAQKFPSKTSFQYILQPEYTKQIQWVKSLCFETDKNLQNLAENYKAQDNLMLKSIALEIEKFITNKRNP